MPFIFIDRGRPSTLPYHAPKTGYKDAVSEVQASESSNPVNQIQNPQVKSYENQQQHQQKKLFLAGDIMTKPVVTVELEHADLQTVWHTMQHHNIKHVVVTIDNSLHGITTERDVLKTVVFHKEEQNNKDTFIQKKVYAATEQTDIHQLAHVMFDQHIGCMPIVNKQQQVLGIVTRSDLLKLASQYGPMEFWA